MRSLDWSKTPLGPVEDWPQSLRTALSIVLGSPNALQIFWGPDLVLLYNDATRPMMGEKHPSTLGQPALEQWPEVESILGPLLRDVMATGKSTATENGMVPTRRNGILEELYFTWSYSPIRIESGEIGGVFQVASETTQEVLGARRRRVLDDLSLLTAAAKSAGEVCTAAMSGLLADDVPFALIYLLEEGAHIARLVAASGIDPGLPQSPVSVDLSVHDASAWRLAEVFRTGTAEVVPDLEARFGAQTAKGWPVPPHRALVLPLAEPQGAAAQGFLVAGLSAGLNLDAGYRSFLNLIAERIAAGIAQVRSLQAAEENRRMAEAMQWVDEVRRGDLRRLFEKAPVAMALMRGREHIYELANEAHMQLCGHRDIIGKNVRDAFPEISGDRFHELLDRVYRTGEAVTGTEVPAKKFRTPGGPPEDCFVTFTYAPFRNSDGSNDGVVAVVSEVTETVRARQRLELLAGQLRLADRRKDEFLAMLGHELRNPLAPISTAVELMRLRDGDNGERERKVIERQVEHLSRLVSDLFDVSRIAQGKIQLHLKVVELSSIVDKALEMASPLFEKRRQNVDVDVPREGLLVDCDVARLAQVVSNILTNAAKFTPHEGHIGVTAAIEGQEVVLRVKDDGTGVEPALLPVMFDLFVQSATALDRKHGGLGLGLALVRNLLTLHGGSVSAHSDGPGLGAELVVRLPRATRPIASLAPPALPPPVTSRRVLIVDDNEDAAELLAEVLRLQGHVVVVAHNGAQALHLLTEFFLEVGVLDIGLPVMNGYELARKIRQIRGGEACQLIAVTGYGRDSDRALGAAAGFDAFFSKPVSLEALLSEIARGPAPVPGR